MTDAARKPGGGQGRHADVEMDGLEQHRLLCAHRRGPYGVGVGARVERGWQAAARYAEEASGTPGRLLITAKDYDLQIYNGDLGG